MTTNFAKPGSRKVPLFFISLWPTLTRDSRTPLTSFLLSPSCSAAIFSINWDFDIIATISFGCPDIRKSNREMQQQVDYSAKHGYGHSNGAENCHPILSRAS